MRSSVAEAAAERFQGAPSLVVEVLSPSSSDIDPERKLETYARGDYATAERFHLEGLELLQRSGDRYGMVDALHQLGETAAASGDYRRAASFYQESLRANAEVGHRELNAGCLEGLAQLADAGGDFERAILLYSAAVLERERISTLGRPGCARRTGVMAQLRERVSPGTFARLQALAASRLLESIIADELSRDESG